MGRGWWVCGKRCKVQGRGRGEWRWPPHGDDDAARQAPEPGPGLAAPALPCCVNNQALLCYAPHRWAGLHALLPLCCTPCPSAAHRALSSPEWAVPSCTPPCCSPSCSILPPSYSSRCSLNRNECRLNPKVSDKQTSNGMSRVKLTFEYLRIYAEAKVIITTRLHCGVPAAAMGVPVILVSAVPTACGGWGGELPNMLLSD